MQTYKKPCIAMLGIMQELYDEMLPGITEKQREYGMSIAKSLEKYADIYFPGPARDQPDIEKFMKEFNEKEYDGIMIVMLTYGPSLRTIRALQNNNLPVLLVNTQPEPSVTRNWDMGNLTYNQGIHGAQDMANALLRTSVSFAVITGYWQSDTFQSRFGEWAKAAQMVTGVKKMKIALLGYPMNGMGDILGDEPAFLRKVGPLVVRENLGEVYECMQQVTDEEINGEISADRSNFAIDPTLPEKDHRYAIKLQVAIEKILKKKGYGGFSAHFESFGRDGRFEQLPILAASNLMSKGYGYAAEGDTNTAALVAAGQILTGSAHFTEMYAMDFDRDSVLMSHMGEGNWRIARKDRPVKLLNRELGIGGLHNPPTPVFMATPGMATIASLVSYAGEKFRLVVAKGEILDTEEMPRVEMPYFHFRPSNGVEVCLNGWLLKGGTHHQCLNLGDVTGVWKHFSEQLGIEFAEV